MEIQTLAHDMHACVLRARVKLVHSRVYIFEAYNKDTSACTPTHYLLEQITEAFSMWHLMGSYVHKLLCYSKRSGLKIH